MELGTLVRYHGGLHSTSPVGVVVRYKPDPDGHWRKDRAYIYWTDTCQKVWHGVWRLEKVIEQ